MHALAGSKRGSSATICAGFQSFRTDLSVRAAFHDPVSRARQVTRRFFRNTTRRVTRRRRAGWARLKASFLFQTGPAYRSSETAPSRPLEVVAQNPARFRMVTGRSRYWCLRQRDALRSGGRSWAVAQPRRVEDSRCASTTLSLPRVGRRSHARLRRRSFINRRRRLESIPLRRETSHFAPRRRIATSSSPTTMTIKRAATCGPLSLLTEGKSP
jgi:hypothetical protein